MAHDVFISYSSKNKAIADAVCAGLESERIRCWIAPRDVLPGGNYGESIVHAMAACRVVVLVFSSATNTSPAVLREMERAMHHGLPIIPFRLEDIPMSPGLEFFLASCHWLDAMHPPMDQHIAKLVHATKALLGREVEPSPVFASQPPASSRKLRLLLPLAAVLLVAAGAWLASRRNPADPPVSTMIPVETGRVSLELAVVESGKGAITEHFRGSALSEVRREVTASADGSLKVRDVCGYLDLWTKGQALKSVTPGSHGCLHDTPLSLELKLLNSTAKTVFFTRAVGEVEHSETRSEPLIVLETPRGNELNLVSLGTDPGLVEFQVAIAGPEDSLDEAKLPAPILLEFRDKRISVPLTNVPGSGESTAFGKFTVGNGSKSAVHRFEIPLGVKAPKAPDFPSAPATEYRLQLRPAGDSYEIECPLSQFIQPGEGDRFVIQLAASESSDHRFRLHLEYDDGTGGPKRLSGPWIDASLFVENDAR